ncbi:MAG: PQQ-binding-like beta-propeller repeat protein [Planctomycetota bacterium]
MRNLALFTTLVVLSQTAFCSDEWPQFRGPGGQNHSEAKGLPVTWSETENIKWKTPLPGEAWSSPVVSGNEIWMTNSTDEGKSLRVISVALDTGKINFDTEVFHVEKPETKHKLNSFASPSPILENGKLYVFFGTYGMACVSTHDGKKVWENTDTKHATQNGAGSTPISYKDKLIVCIDGMDVQYQLALNKSDGKVAWKTPRSIPFKPTTKTDAKKAYGTPLLYQVDGKDQIVAPAAEAFYAYDPNTGKELWRLAHPGFSNVPIPVFANGLLFLDTGFMRAQMWCVKPIAGGGEKLDLPPENVLWKLTSQGTMLADVGKPDAKPVTVSIPTRPTPVIVGNRMYMISDTGILTSVDTATGHIVWIEKLLKEYSMSPMYADGHIYLFNHIGAAIVFEPGDTFKKLAENTLEEGCMASPAIVGKALIVRTKKALYRIEK